MQYSVSLKNISENDQLVLKLIFSLSAKARGRTHSYCLNDDGMTQSADIFIQHPSDETLLKEDAPHSTVWLDGHDESGNSSGYNIKKPLFASRVLSVLDRYVDDQQQRTDQNEAATPASDTLALSEPEQSDVAQLEFCISEEEASQLAIVEDESLSNPANSTPVQVTPAAPETETVQAERPDKVTSLVILHKNREIEISKQAFDKSAESNSETKPRALVVDDSPSVRKQIELELDLFNVDVDFAESVADAMAQLDNNQYDVVFLDVVLPDGDGFRICRSIKTGNSNPTVIMLTGKASPADKIKGTMAGCDAYLVKPVGRMTFQNTVCNYLQLRQQLEVIHA